MTPPRVLSLPHELIPVVKQRMGKRVVRSESGCLEWVGAMGAEGYGVIGVKIDGKVRNLSAHRASWMVNKGPIPHGLVLDHLCRVRKCVNVEHLEPVMSGVNTLRGIESRRGKTTTPRPPWMDHELWARAKEDAAEHGVDVSYLVHHLLSAWLNVKQGEK